MTVRYAAALLRDAEDGFVIRLYVVPTKWDTRTLEVEDVRVAEDAVVARFFVAARLVIDADEVVRVAEELVVLAACRTVSRVEDEVRVAEAAVVLVR